MYEINVYDNLVPDELRKEVWEYIQNQTWYATWKATVPTPHVIHTYVPAVDKERRVPMKKHFFKPIIEDDEE